MTAVTAPEGRPAGAPPLPPATAMPGEAPPVARRATLQARPASSNTVEGEAADIAAEGVDAAPLRRRASLQPMRRDPTAVGVAPEAGSAPTLTNLRGPGSAPAPGAEGADFPTAAAEEILPIADAPARARASLMPLRRDPFAAPATDLVSLPASGGPISAPVDSLGLPGQLGLRALAAPRITGPLAPGALQAAQTSAAPVAGWERALMATGAAGWAIGASPVAAALLPAAAQQLLPAATSLLGLAAPHTGGPTVGTDAPRPVFATPTVPTAPDSGSADVPTVTVVTRTTTAATASRRTAERPAPISTAPAPPGATGAMAELFAQRLIASGVLPPTVVTPPVAGRILSLAQEFPASGQLPVLPLPPGIPPLFGPGAVPGTASPTAPGPGFRAPEMHPVTPPSAPTSPGGEYEEVPAPAPGRIPSVSVAGISPTTATPGGGTGPLPVTYRPGAPSALGAATPGASSAPVIPTGYPGQLGLQAQAAPGIVAPSAGAGGPAPVPGMAFAVSPPGQLAGPSLRPAATGPGSALLPGTVPGAATTDHTAAGSPGAGPSTVTTDGVPRVSVAGLPAAVPPDVLPNRRALGGAPLPGTDALPLGAHLDEEGPHPSGARASLHPVLGHFAEVGSPMQTVGAFGMPGGAARFHSGLPFFAPGAAPGPTQWSGGPVPIGPQALRGPGGMTSWGEPVSSIPGWSPLGAGAGGGGYAGGSFGAPHSSGGRFGSGFLGAAPMLGGMPPLAAALAPYLQTGAGPVDFRGGSAGMSEGTPPMLPALSTAGLGAPQRGGMPSLPFLGAAPAGRFGGGPAPHTLRIGAMGAAGVGPSPLPDARQGSAPPLMPTGAPGPTGGVLARFTQPDHAAEPSPGPTLGVRHAAVPMAPGAWTRPAPIGYGGWDHAPAAPSLSRGGGASSPWLAMPVPQHPSTSPALGPSAPPLRQFSASPEFGRQAEPQPPMSGFQAPFPPSLSSFRAPAEQFLPGLPPARPGSPSMVLAGVFREMAQQASSDLQLASTGRSKPQGPAATGGKADHHSKAIKSGSKGRGPSPVEMDLLARQVYRLVKQKLAVERERRGGF